MNCDCLKFKFVKLRFNNIVITIYDTFSEEKINEKSLGKVGDFELYGNANEKGSITYTQFPLNGFSSLRLTETQIYYVSIENSGYKLGFGDLKHSLSSKNVYSFKYVNYLGKSHIDVFDNQKQKITEIVFDVIPDKIDYEEDYVKLTEDIAEQCSALLLDIESPTSLSFEVSETSTARTPLEKFIFIRKFCNFQELEYLINSIKNNPDSRFVCDEEMKPLGQGPISNRFYTNPVCSSKNWFRNESGQYLPQYVTTSYKYDSLDTVANRFIKFAMNTFIDICDELTECLGDNRNTATYYEEALLLKSNLEHFLSDSFFVDVQDLAQMPNNNQVLQKREGYRQIYSAFNMLDLAQQLDWQGHDDAFHGQAKNTALLYEYWLVFQILSVLKQDIGTEIRELESDDVSEMIRLSKDNRLIISLKEGYASRTSFISRKYKMLINFYYNRSFSPNEFKSNKYFGSYSSPFRPDYTLAIFPLDYYEKGPKKSEEKAIENGDCSFVHFDAKYRITDIKNLFGGNSESSAEANENQNEPQSYYKREDLLKMHTYNDAIRKTIGSYVLYPGNQNKKYRIFDELLPGVGAFAIKPSDKGSGRKALKEFIQDVIAFKAKVSSRLYRRDYYENIIIHSPKEKQSNIVILNETSIKVIEPNKTPVMLGYLRNDYHDLLMELGKIPTSEQSKICSNEFYFYYHAIEEGGFVQPLHKDINKTRKFIGYIEDEQGKSKILNFIADIENSELVSREKLIENLSEYDTLAKSKQHRSLYYYLLRITNITYCDNSTIELPIDTGNSVLSNYTPKVIWL